jgi:hypothetical protein
MLLFSLVAALTPQECREFLGRTLPAGDLVPAYEGIIAENIELALSVRDSVPWGQAIPDSIFLRYVLPPRVSQEPLVSWRPLLAGSVVPRALRAGELEAAALSIDAWIDSLTLWRMTQLRDQSPLVTLSSGIGRCEELTVLNMDALRSACIPCRQVYSPWWMDCDGNHAWLEVWTFEGWKCVDASCTQDSLGYGWFTANASRTGVVCAVSLDSVPGALAYRGGVSILDVTPEYAATGLIRIPDDTTSVAVCIANYGAIRPIFMLRPPVRQAAVGAGVYMLTWGWPVRSLLVAVAAGDTLDVDLASETPMEGHFHMNYRQP